MQDENIERKRNNNKGDNSKGLSRDRLQIPNQRDEVLIILDQICSYINNIHKRHIALPKEGEKSIQIMIEIVWESVSFRASAVEDRRAHV